LVRRANATFARTCVFRVYGASEVPLVTFGYLGAANAELAATTDGEIIDYEVRIVGDDGAELPRGSAGEILARGPAMFVGYAEASQTGAAITSDGFFRTGDVGIVTPRGSLIVTGRKKDLIIRGGEKISPKEIEDILHMHPGISEAAVVSMPHQRLGEGVCAYIVARPGYELDLESVGAHVTGHGLARQKCPEHILIVPALPKTASGKVRKDLLRAEVRAQLERDEHRP
jgi:non-ribosomal peptide synthetase component E (peptide arylation enzyme)